LRAWLATVALRAALKLLRERSEQVSLGEQGLEHLIGQTGDPELQYMQQRYRRAFQRAFVDTLLMLTTRDRLLLKLRYVQGLEIEDVARFLGVHRATAFRALAQLRDDLSRGIRERMRSTLGVTSGSLDSLLRAIVSGFQLSLDRLLRRLEPKT
jgi:RNA polymerase sigma-70 factor (ECF subfamily)